MCTKGIFAGVMNERFNSTQLHGISRAVLISVQKCHSMVLTGQAGETEHPRLLCNMVPAARGAQSFQTFSEVLPRSLQALHHYLNSFTPEENQGKHLV